MKREWKKIAVIYNVAVIVYVIIVSFFTSTVHVEVDEELYIGLARSFHYDGRFEMGGELLNYNCVLYSILLSFAYFFYSPERILFLMRILGVVCMCSSIFPIWFLAAKILNDEKLATKVSAFSLLFPYMFDSAYMMQEVLSYPLFLWTIYFLSQSYENRKEKINYRDLVLAACFAVLCFFTKTYLFLIPVTVTLISILYAWKTKEKSYFRKICIFDSAYVILTIAAFIVINMINGFETGSNHYASQFSHLFPISGKTIIAGALDCSIYLAFFIVNMGVFPLAAVVYERIQRRKNREWLLDFSLLSMMVMLAEIVVLIVLTEEGIDTLPHKFLFRYFHIWVPIVLIYFIKIKEKKEFLRSKGTWLVTGASLAVVIIYFAYMKGNTRAGIIDGHMFLLLENATKYVLPYADVIAMVMVSLCAVGCIYAAFHDKIDIMKLIFRGYIAVVIVFWIINCIQLPVYTNVIAGGKTIQDDSIKIATYLNENDYEYVYYVCRNATDKGSYLRNVYGYIKQPYQLIQENDIKILLGKKRKAALLCTEKLQNSVHELQEIDLNNEKIYLYIIEGG